MEIPRLGRFMIGLGVLGLFRVVSELLQMFRFAMVIYFVISGLDVILALATIAAGNGLRRRNSWAPRAAMRVAGFSLANALGMSILLAPEVIAALSGLFSVENAILVPRLFFYLVAVVFWPATILWVLRSAPPESRRSLRISCQASFAVGAVVAALFFVP